jgi:hypothetical protein
LETGLFHVRTAATGQDTVPVDEIKGLPGDLINRPIELLNNDGLGEGVWYEVGSSAQGAVGGRALTSLPDTRKEHGKHNPTPGEAVAYAESAQVLSATCTARIASPISRGLRTSTVLRATTTTPIHVRISPHCTLCAYSHTRTAPGMKRRSAL